MLGLDDKFVVFVCCRVEFGETEEEVKLVIGLQQMALI